jgi:hypothetical protein
MILPDFHRIDDHVILPDNLLQHRRGLFGYPLLQGFSAAFRNPHQTVFEIADRMLALPQGTHAVPSVRQAETCLTDEPASSHQQTGDSQREAGGNSQIMRKGGARRKEKGGANFCRSKNVPSSLHRRR